MHLVPKVYLAFGGTLLVACLSAVALVCFSSWGTSWLLNDQLPTRKTVCHQSVSTLTLTTTTTLRRCPSHFSPRIRSSPLCGVWIYSLLFLVEEKNKHKPQDKCPPWCAQDWQLKFAYVLAWMLCDRVTETRQTTFSTEDASRPTDGYSAAHQDHQT